MPIPRAALHRTIAPRLATAATTWGELLGIFAGQPEPARWYVVVAVGPGRYDVLALADLDVYRAASSEPDAALRLTAVPGLLRPGEAVYATQVNSEQARQAMHARPRRRLVVLDDHGDVAGVMAAARLGAAATPSVPELATEPQLSAQFAGLLPISPLVVGRAAQLEVSVGAPGDQRGSRPFAFCFGDDPEAVRFEVSIDADPEAWAITAVEPTMLVAPPGITAQAATFMVMALRPGRDKLRIAVERGGVPLQCLWRPVLAVREGASVVLPSAQHWPEIALPLDAAGAARPVVELTIQPELEGSLIVVRADLPQGTVRESYRVPVSTVTIQSATLRLRQELERISLFPDPTGHERFLFASQRTLSIDLSLARQVYAPLAHAGQMVWELLFQAPRGDPRLAHLAAELRSLPAGSVLRVVIESQELILPWALLYDQPGPISAETLVWDGFWGYRYALEVIPPGRYPAPAIPARSPMALMLFSDDGALRSSAEAHLHHLEAALGPQLVSVGWGHTEAQAAFQEPGAASVLYCLCHGAQAGAGGASLARHTALPAESALQFSPGQSLRLADLRRLPAAHLGSRPIVFLNTCEGASQDPFCYDGFMPFFIEQQGARAFISTEVKAPQLLAYDLAQRFLRAFAESQPLGTTLWRLRRHYLDRHANIMAFNYSLYGPGEAHLARAPSDTGAER